MQRPFPGSFVLLSCVLFCYIAQSQEHNDTEFKNGWVTYLNLDNGIVTNFHAAPDLYAGGLHLTPQYTIITHKLRAGVNAGFVYVNKKFSGMVGPSVAMKLKSFSLGEFGGLANLQLIGEHTWGTEKQRMVGLGMGLELLQKLIFSITTHRDYHLNNWWIQSHIGINLKKNKATLREFNQ